MTSTVEIMFNEKFTYVCLLGIQCVSIEILVCFDKVPTFIITFDVSSALYKDSHKSFFSTKIARKIKSCLIRHYHDTCIISFLIFYWSLSTKQASNFRIRNLQSVKLRKSSTFTFYFCVRFSSAFCHVKTQTNGKCIWL